MSSISCDGSAATRILPGAPNVSLADVGKVFRLFPIALAVTLAGCAQSSVITNKSALAPGRQASLESHTKPSFFGDRHAAVAAKEHAPSATNEHAKDVEDASYGLAS